MFLLVFHRPAVVEEDVLVDEDRFAGFKPGPAQSILRTWTGRSQRNGLFVQPEINNKIKLAKKLIN